MIDLDLLIKSALALFIIMDPFASLPTFLMLTKKQTDSQKFHSVITATAIATITLATFVLIGPWLMNVLTISMPAFTIAGGILLLLTAVVTFLGIEISPSKIEKNMDIRIVVIAVPLLTGPGAMTTAVILANLYGLLTVFCAIAIVVAMIFAVLSLAQPIAKLAGKTGIEIFSKVFSIILAAFAIEFIKNGVFQIIIEWGII